MKKKNMLHDTEYRDSSLQHFPNSRDNTSLFKRITLEGQEDQSLQRLLAIFPTISLSDPDRAVLPHHFMPIIKERQGKREKMVNHLYHSI
jgi:hypothetical protein